MIAIIKVGGHQALVEAGEVIRVDKLNAKEGETLHFDTLLISEKDGSAFQLGAPLLDATVEAKVLEHGRDAKIRVFKMKRRKRYRKTIGHKQDHTIIEIISIGGSTAKKTKAAPKTEAKAAPKKTTTKKTAEKAPAKKPAAKKAVAKKTETK